MAAQEKEQLRLDICHESTADSDPVDVALAYHDGDARATIATLLADCGFLREELALAASIMSRGMGRGWEPHFDREI